MSSYQRCDKTAADARGPIGAAIIKRRLLAEDGAIPPQIGQITAPYGIKR